MTTQADYQRLRDLVQTAHESIEIAIDLTTPGGPTRTTLIRACLDLQDAMRAWDNENHEESLMLGPPPPPPKEPGEEEE